MTREMMTETMKAAISKVMETMFFQPVQIRVTNGSLREWFSRSGLLHGAILDFSGPLSGSVYLIMPEKVGREITGNFLGIGEEEIDEEQREDTVKEALNMIVGQMFSLFDKDGVYKQGIPMSMAETWLAGKNLEQLKGEKIFIETEDEHLAAGIATEWTE